VSATRLLLTGFEPFGGSAVNPSKEAIAALAADPPREVSSGAVELSTVILPVVGGTGPGSAAAALREAVERERPDAIVCLGETGSRDTICVERVAVNVRDYRIADNAGVQVSDAAVIDRAPNELSATIPIDALVMAIRSCGVPVEASTNAGRFLCNEIMFHAISLAAQHGLRGAGFVHVPQLPEQIAVAPARAAGALAPARIDRPPRRGMPLTQIVTAVHCIVAVLAAESSRTHA